MNNTFKTQIPFQFLNITCLCSFIYASVANNLKQSSRIITPYKSAPIHCYCCLFYYIQYKERIISLISFDLILTWHYASLPWAHVFYEALQIRPGKRNISTSPYINILIHSLLSFFLLKTVLDQYISCLFMYFLPFLYNNKNSQKHVNKNKK